MTKTIFVIDDDEHTRILIGAQLKSLGDVETFDSAEKALEQAKIKFPDLVVSDIDMSGMSGLDLLKWFREQSLYLPVILVSAFHSDDNLFNALDNGATDFICKPFPLRNIKTAARNALSIEQPKGSVDVESSGDWTSFTFDSDHEYLRRVNSLISTLVEKKTNKGICHAIKFAIEEIGTNAIEWGNNNNPDMKVTIRYRLDAHKITLIIEDEGAGFKNLGLPSAPKDAKDFQELRKEQGKRPGGYGLKLVAQTMDQVIWNKAGNRILMTRYLTDEEELDDPREMSEENRS